MIKIILIVLPVFVLISCGGGEDKNVSTSGEISLREISFQGIRGNVYDAETSEILSARIEIRTEEGILVDTYYEHLPGIYTEEDGSFEKELDPGNYRISFYHGMDYLSDDINVEITPGNGADLRVFLTPWIDLKAKGWVNGDGHCHLYTDEELNVEMLQKVRQICLAQGLDFMCTNQGWAGFNDDNWRDGYSKFSDERFYIHYGSEMPKYRTGHTWWIGQESTRGYFWNTMDENYEQKYFQSTTEEKWNFDDLKFPYIPGVEVIQRIKEADNAVAIIPHPTSWWWQDRGDITKYTTNIASYLSFGLLAGKIWDGLVVMGYDRDHYIYQQLWFHVLNQGYRMPAIAELDGGFRKNDRFYYGSMRSYFHIEGDFTIDKVVDAVRRGETFVTSGPVIFADIDRKYRIGEIIPSGNTEHEMNIEALASGDSEDYLSYVLIFRNGEIFKLWDLRKEKPRKFNESINIVEEEQAWYVIKAYGANAWKDPANLDVLKVCEQLFFDSTPPAKEGPHDVALTSPFYFWPENVKDPQPMESKVNLRLVSDRGEEIEKAVVSILINGREIKTVDISEGKASFTMPVHGILKIQTEANPPIYRGLFFDYKPHLDLVEKLATGRWMEDYSPEAPFSAGEVPWDAFNFESTREVLVNPDWEIILKPNERDTLWDEFEKLF
jgi:hypothetical protein